MYIICIMVKCIIHNGLQHFHQVTDITVIVQIRHEHGYVLLEAAEKCYKHNCNTITRVLSAC